MGFRFRKNINFGPFRLNLSKSGIGYSIGGKGFRVTKKAGGGHRTTASIPGTGISYVKDSSKKKTSTSSHKGADTTMNSNTPVNPKKKKKWPYILAALLIIGAIGSVLPDNDNPSDPDANNITNSSMSSADTSIPKDNSSVNTSEPSDALSDPLDVVIPSDDPAENDTPPEPEKPSEPEQTPDTEPDSTPGQQPTLEPDDEQNSQTSSSQQEPDSNPQNSRTVYITKTGSKYHYDNNCGNGTYYESTLYAAKSRGLEPCAKCAGG